MNNPLWKKLEDILVFFGISSPSSTVNKDEDNTTVELDYFEQSTTIALTPIQAINDDSKESNVKTQSEEPLANSESSTVLSLDLESTQGLSTVSNLDSTVLDTKSTVLDQLSTTFDQKPVVLTNLDSTILNTKSAVSDHLSTVLDQKTVVSTSESPVLNQGLTGSTSKSKVSNQESVVSSSESTVSNPNSTVSNQDKNLNKELLILAQDVSNSKQDSISFNQSKTIENKNKNDETTNEPVEKILNLLNISDAATNLNNTITLIEFNNNTNSSNNKALASTTLIKDENRQFFINNELESLNNAIDNTDGEFFFNKIYLLDLV